MGEGIVVSKHLRMAVPSWWEKALNLLLFLKKRYTEGLRD